jgi:hypothetical protein
MITEAGFALLALLLLLLVGLSFAPMRDLVARLALRRRSDQA